MFEERKALGSSLCQVGADEGGFKYMQSALPKIYKARCEEDGLGNEG